MHIGWFWKVFSLYSFRPIYGNRSLHIPTYLNLPVVFLLSPFSVGKCKSSFAETNPSNQIPATIRFAVPANRWSSSHPLLNMDQSYSDSNPPMRSWRKPEDFTSYCGVVDLGATLFVRIYLHPFLVPTRTKDVKTPSSKTFEGYLYDISKQSSFIFTVK